MTEAKRWKRRPDNSTWGDYGPDDQLGRMNELTAEKVKQGISEVKEGCAKSAATARASALLTSRRLDCRGCEPCQT